MFEGAKRARRRRTAALAFVAALWCHTLIAQTPKAMTITVAAELERGDEIRRAAEDAVARYSEWLGPARFDRIDIVWRSNPSSTPPGALTITVDRPFLRQALLMEAESQVAYGVALGWLPGLRTSDDAVPIDQGLAWYLQSRIVERQFNLRTGATAYSSDRVASFGGAVRWPLTSLRLSRWSAGLGRDLFLHAASSSRPDGVQRLPPGMRPPGVRAALAFGTLERWLGWPTLQGALSSVVQQSRARPLSAKDAVAVLGASIGQDLSWFFDQVLDPTRSFDYAVDAVNVQTVTDGCASAPCYRTEVVAVRRGSAVFTGTSTPPAGEYESGAALELRVTFEGDQTVTAHWDGRAERRVFAFDSPTPPLHVSLDPARVLLLNERPQDTLHNLTPQTNVPVRKWIARWMVWLQDAALAYTSLL